jgi:hypothetical protein
MEIANDDELPSIFAVLCRYDGTRTDELFAVIPSLKRRQKGLFAAELQRSAAGAQNISSRCWFISALGPAAAELEPFARGVLCNEDASAVEQYHAICALAAIGAHSADTVAAMVELLSRWLGSGRPSNRHVTVDYVVTLIETLRKMTPEAKAVGPEIRRIVGAVSGARTERIRRELRLALEVLGS